MKELSKETFFALGRSVLFEKRLKSVLRMQLLSAARTPIKCEPVMQRNDKPYSGKNFPVQHFQEAFQIGLSRSKRCGSSEKHFFRRGHPTSDKYLYTAISKLNMQKFAPGFSERKF